MLRLGEAYKQRNAEAIARLTRQIGSAAAKVAARVFGPKEPPK